MNVDFAAKYLKEGKLVAIPTETVYGLAANGLNDSAIVKIFEAKNRPFFDPLILHIHSFEEIKKYATSFPSLAKILAEHFWPGPLSIVLPKKDIISDLVTAGLPDAAFRIPDHPLTLQLLKKLDFPLAAPSANPFGYISPTTALHVEDQLGEKVDYILDGGACKIGIESTIITFENEIPVILRLGGVSVEQIEKVLGLKVKLKDNGFIKAPGMTASHYAPTKKLIIGAIDQLLNDYSKEKVGIISFQKNYLNSKFSWTLSPSGNIQEAAKNLFLILREADKSGADIIISEFVPDVGIGRAINDRLRKASAKRDYV